MRGGGRQLFLAVVGAARRCSALLGTARHDCWARRAGWAGWAYSQAARLSAAFRSVTILSRQIFGLPWAALGQQSRADSKETCGNNSCYSFEHDSVMELNELFELIWLFLSVFTSFLGLIFITYPNYASPYYTYFFIVIGHIFLILFTLACFLLVREGVPGLLRIKALW